MAKEKNYAIFGLGTFGFEICTELVDQGCRVVAIDSDFALIEKIKDRVMHAIQIDSTDEDAFNNLPLENIDVAIVAIGDNLESSIITTALLKKMNIPYVIARARSDIHAAVLKQIGADEIINLEIEEGKRIAHRLVYPNIIERIPISKDLVFAEIVVPKNFIGKNMQKLNLRNKYNINVISIKRYELMIDEMGNPVKNEIVILQKPTDILQKNDILIVIGNNKDIESLKEL